MEKSLDEMYKRHKREIDELQKRCHHERLSDWETIATRKSDSNIWGSEPIEQIKHCENCYKNVKRQVLVEVWKEELL